MRKIAPYFFFLFVCLVSTLEGIGISGARLATLYLIIGIPPFLLLKSATNGKIHFPKVVTKLFLLFLAASLLSIPLSANVVNSISFLLFYSSCFIAFLYSYNNKEILKRFILPLIFSLSFLFCLFSIINNQQSIINPQNGYQFVFSRFGSHNHLGDFLILPLIICFYYLFTNRTKIFNPKSLICNLLILFFLPYFLFSYSRSAYLSLIITLIVMVGSLVKSKKLKIKPASVGFFILVIAISLVFFFSVAGSSQKIGVLNNVYQELTEQNQLHYKTPYGARGEYIREAALSIIKRPILGVGPGNFIVTSKEFNPIAGLWTESAHNIFLDIFVENGAIAGVLFVLLMFELFRRSKRDIYFYLTMGMLLNFQTDYTYRIFSFLLLFFIILGMNYNEKENLYL